MMNNFVILKGNVGNAPRFYTLSNGKTKMSFPLAVKRFWNDSSTGELKSESQWFNVFKIGDRDKLETLAKKLIKGSFVEVSGRLDSYIKELPAGDTILIVEVFADRIGTIYTKREPEGEGNDEFNVGSIEEDIIE